HATAVGPSCPTNQHFDDLESQGLVRNLNQPNRRMRTRMSGGVAGEQADEPPTPNADPAFDYGATASSAKSSKRTPARLVQTPACPSPCSFAAESEAVSTSTPSIHARRRVGLTPTASS